MRDTELLVLIFEIILFCKMEKRLTKLFLEGHTFADP